MRNAPRGAALAGAALLLAAAGISGRALARERQPSAKPAAAASGEVESGVYGFSGAIKGGSALSGVIGECIWIYDADNKKLVATGDCDQGNFRVALKPGEYVVRGPGGNQKIDVKPHQWVKIKSLVELPGSL
jgi:hypothetical protein